MVVADPAAELVGLVRALGDPAPAAAPAEVAARARLVRRRFGLSLPPPFAGPADAATPVRPAVAADGAAIASVKYRVFGTTYRGILPDAFLDARDVVPPVAFWVGRAMVPPSRRHRLLAWGRPGEVLGYVDSGPAREGEPGAAAGSAAVGEVYELYVDPAAQGLGGGRRLLAAAEEALAAAGFVALELSVLRDNHAARGFYGAMGWHDTGVVDHVDLGVVAFDELRLRKDVGGARTGAAP